MPIIGLMSYWNVPRGKISVTITFIIHSVLVTQNVFPLHLDVSTENITIFTWVSDKLQICAGIGKKILTLYFIINSGISCLVSMYIYRLHIGWNNTSPLRDNFYFPYFSELPYYQLSGGILDIDFKLNSGAGTE